MKVNLQMAREVAVHAADIQAYIENEIENHCEWSDIQYDGDDYRLFVSLVAIEVSKNIIKDLTDA